MIGRTKNEGIQIDGGSLSAKNVASGRGAVASSSDVTVSNLDSLFELRELVTGSDLSAEDRVEACNAIDAIEGETKKDQPDKSKVDLALHRLESLGKASTALFPLADRLLPLLKKVSSLFV